MLVRGRRAFAAGSFAFLWLACGGSARQQSNSPYEISVVAGRYSNGSGSQSLALLAIVRDSHGEGPSAPWSASVIGANGAQVATNFAYDSSKVGSLGAWWWPTVPVSDGDSYQLKLTDPSSSPSTKQFRIPTATPLGLAQVGISGDGATLTWPRVSGAASYQCQVFSNGAVQLSATSNDAGCDVSALPPGSYTASVFSMTADLTALSANALQTPPLPVAFDVSESNLAFATGSSGGFRLSAVGGGINYGGASPGLAVWVGLTQLTGLAPAAAWTLTVTGPGIPANAPLQLSYPASLTQELFWSYDAPATPGTYSLVATSGSNQLFTQFAVGAVGSLHVAQNVAVAPSASGAAVVGFDAVAGAHSYYVSIWSHAAKTLTAAKWVTASPASFPTGTLAPGTYDTYVAAANANLVDGGTPGGGVVMSENTYSPVSFGEP